jgi:hypothetical protein
VKSVSFKLISSPTRYFDTDLAGSDLIVLALILSAGQCTLRLLMIRRLLIVAFVLSVAANSLAAVVPIIEGDSGCSGCCNAARRNEPRLGSSKFRCPTECNQQRETQRSTPASLQGTEREKKDSSLVAVDVAVAHPLPSGFLHSPARSIVQSTHIYLRTGTLLI